MTIRVRSAARSVSVDLFETLSHEVSHQFTHLVCRGTIPSRLNQGLATYVEFAVKRLCGKGLDLLFERSRGAPGLLLPLYRAVLHRVGLTKCKVDPLQVEEILERWDMP